MKLIVAALLVFIGSWADAQSAKPAIPDLASVNPEAIQMELVTVPAIDISPGSATVLDRVNSIPDAPRPIPMTASIQAIPNSRSKEFKTFRSDRFNRLLVANEFWWRGLDAFSTYSLLNDPCRCFHEETHLFGQNMTSIFKNPMGIYSYSFGMATAFSLTSARLWDAGKNHPRHTRLLQTLSRALLIADSSVEFTADVHNLKLHSSHSGQRKSVAPVR